MRGREREELLRMALKENEKGKKIRMEKPSVYLSAGGENPYK